VKAVMTLLLASVFAGPAAAQAPATSSPAPVTLQDAVRRSLAVQPAMVQAVGDRRNAGAANLSSWGAFLPSFTTGVSANRSNVGTIDRTTGLPVPPQYSYTLSLNASLDLFTGFRRLANKSAASAQVDAADAEVTNQQFQTTLATKQVFFNALATAQLVDVAAAQVKRTRQELDIAAAKMRAGSGTRSDSLRAAVDYGNAELALLQAQANQATANANLARQIGADGPVAPVADTTVPPPPDTTGLRAAVLTSSPQVEQADQQARAARAAIWTARAQYFPTINVAYGDNRQGIGSVFTNPESFSWRFGLQWTVFNGFSREQSQTSAAVSADVADARAVDARRGADAQLTQQMAALFTAYAQVGISQANADAAAEDLRVQSERYRVGSSTSLDLLTSEAALVQAQVNLVQSQFNYRIARAQLEALIGHDL